MVWTSDMGKMPMPRSTGILPVSLLTSLPVTHGIGVTEPPSAALGSDMNRLTRRRVLDLTRERILFEFVEFPLEAVG